LGEGCAEEGADYAAAEEAYLAMCGGSSARLALP